jgi:hypothetical protein
MSPELDHRDDTSEGQMTAPEDQQKPGPHSGVVLVDTSSDEGLSLPSV